jgi:pantoate--beta-alanine ligase
MGALHEGHLTLVDAARRVSDAVVMSIFVNPLQFGAGEDLARYPRNLDRDRALVRERGVDLLFVPETAVMYPPGADTRVVPGDAAGLWEGAARPGHFTGVLTVVAKLFHLVEPDVACFGQKDIQQFTLIRRMVRDLDWNIRLERVPIAREPDGLAMSSRNVYLSPEDRREATGIHAALRATERAWAAGERHTGRLAAVAQGELELHRRLSAEYIAIMDPEELLPVAEAVPGTIVAIAARIGGTRLIDNVILGEG